MYNCINIVYLYWRRYLCNVILNHSLICLHSSWYSSFGFHHVLHVVACANLQPHLHVFRVMPTSHTCGRMERIQFPVTSILSLAERTEAQQTMHWFNSVPTDCHLPFLTPTRISCSTSSTHSKSDFRDIVWQMLFLQMGGCQGSYLTLSWIFI